MRFHVPSFKSQVIALILLILLTSVLFFRLFFMQSYQDYKTNIETLKFEEHLTELYQTHKDHMSIEDAEQLHADISSLLEKENQRKLASNFFEDEISLYSIFILAFIVIVMLIVSLVSFTLITRPLSRLQAATGELSKGNWDILIPESRFSPLNSLIISFNTMIGEIVLSRDKLISAEKDVVWREMARVMAHEIKNPLTPIQLTAERIEYKLARSPESVNDILPDAIAVIKEEIANLKKLTVAFSQFAKLPESQQAHFDLNDLIREVIVPYQAEAVFKINLDKNLPELNGDKFQIRQVLVNLIQNAIQACELQAEIELNTHFSNGVITFRVKDNGKGILEEDIGKIFEPYFSKRKKGTGLGLAIVRKIIEQHSGSINVTSQPHKGTEFVIQIQT